ncbi:E3 ubiquitin-protein ligase TRIM71-like [Orbicella faveolata]|uniref:E3 ubiquitin-protein ligase TRIM71-like n=1 Tax=Orbicella faveolata TaxID=48498 RepID=UPI0009E32C38|nr:E3 ubiquitin-protein ligase TRIM71-like [Orbicella faveolata]
MDVKTLLHNLREEVCCSVCSDIFTDPKQLPCLHSFCLHCLKQWHRTSHGRDTIRCPKCQLVSKVPERGDLKDLPTSFYLNGLIDVLAIKECRSSQVRCGNCEKKSSETSYCFHCCIFYCQECVTGHNIMRNNKDHRVLALNDFQDMDYEDVLKRPVFCAKQRHEKEELKYFCKNCELAVCQTCVTLSHSGHALEHIEEEAERQKIEMKSMIETQRRNLQAKMDAVTKLDEDYAKLIQQCEEVKRDVQGTVDDLIANIEAKKQNIFAAVEDQTKKSLDSLTTQKSETENQIEEIKSSLDKADKVLTRSANAEVVQVKKSLQTILKGVDQTTKPSKRDLKGLPILVFVENQKMLETVNAEEIGTLKLLQQTEASHSVAEGKGLEEGTVGGEEQFVVTTRNAEGEQCYSKHDRVTVEITDEQGRECATEVRINDNKDGSYKISYSPKDQGKYKVTVKVNGKHICKSPFSLQVKLFHLRPVLSFGKQGSSVGMFNYPWGVEVNVRDEIAVTDGLNQRVQVFNSDGKYLRSFGREGHNAGEFDYPTGITFHKNGNIFVANNGKHRIQIFSGEGEHVGMFGGYGSLDSQLSNPCGLSVDSDGNIIVADAGNKLIKIFSPDGKFLMKIGGQGSFTYPIHCVQCDRYLIVPDYEEHCIKVYDRYGNFQYKFGKQGGRDGELNKPCFLSVNKSGQLMVCDSGNNRIQVFELNGKFVGKFGTKGSNLGEFGSPRSVAVLSNGRIVVCEWLNHRLQLFE